MTFHTTSLGATARPVPDRPRWLASVALACLLFPAPVGAQDRGREGEARDVEAQEPTRKQGPSPAPARQGRAERDLKAALEAMTSAKKLTAKQSAEMYRIVFPEEANEQARFEAYLKENPEVAKALKSGKVTREQALAGFRARASEKGPSREELLDAAHAKLLEEEPTLGRTPRKELLPRLEKIIAEGKVSAAASKPNTRQRTMTFGLYCNDLIESGQVERFDTDLQKVFDTAIAEIERQGAGEVAAGSVLDLEFSVYDVQPDWDQVLGKTLKLSDETPVASGAVNAGQVDLELRRQVLPERAGAGTFAMRFEGRLPLEEAGEYTFRLRADDQAQLFIDEKLVASFLGNAVGEPTTVKVALGAGDHALRVDFADWGGDWWIELEMVYPSGRVFALASPERGFDRGLERERVAGRAERSAPAPVDWDAEYERFLVENPKAKEQVEAGRITKDQVLAGIKARARESEPRADEELEEILAAFERLRPGSSRDLRARLDRGEITLEEMKELLGPAPERGFDRGLERGRAERRRPEGSAPADWDAEYQRFLRENPRVKEQVDAGRITKDQVLAGIKARAKEAESSAAEAWEAKLKRFWEYEKRDDPRRWVGKTFEQVRPELEQMLREEPDGWERDNEEEAETRDPWEAKFQVFLRQYPALRDQLEVHGLRKANVIWMLKQGALELDENDGAAQQARAERALKAALEAMTSAKKLTAKQSAEMYRIVFPEQANEQARFEAYLKENPEVAKALSSGKVTREQALAGFRARASEKGPTREELLDAAHAKLLEEEPTLGRTPRKELLPRLEKIIAEGKVSAAASKPNTRQRTMTFGLYCNDLIESGQVERFDEGLKKVVDVAISEIVRQGGAQDRGANRPDAQRERAGAHRGERGRRGAPGTLKWSVPLGGAVGYHSPAVAEDGTIYMAGGRQRLVALHPDGTEKWAFVAGSGYPIAGAAIGQDGTIYIGTWSEDGSDSRIYAITADGTEKWSYPVGDKIEFSSPAIGKDGTIYIGCYDDHLYAMNPDGTLRWRFRADFNLMSSPAVGQDGTIYIASENGKLYAVNPEDGSKKWDFQAGNYIHGSPSIAKDGTVYIGSSDKNLYALNPDGSEKWRFTAQDQVHAPPAIGEDGTLYVGSNDGSFYALNPDGTKKWSFRTGKRVDNCSAAIGKDGTVYFGSDDNHIYALNPDGSEKWRFRMNGVDDMDSSPAIGEDGTIYVGSMDGNLYAIHGESGGLAETPWPMFGGSPRHAGRARENERTKDDGKKQEPRSRGDRR